ncbi:MULTISPECIES: LacI family DNA-binding transcriptional regulator [unclassified Rhodococcus (in: high G+C Gram-positive bacteria)]|uniref:LacI family DNA-binding transcriptional regulator n=1 Tax=unclassified Rhodococcus (in: high G+C Gram-positive bacteria) TaxID=192944 RepID=UPI002078BFF4|nr:MULTISPECIES: LacI family DNA-binding transcriptional regulator [unclassified Rhodococcus (in: high G+C Gram-positive bacteria)]
MRSDDDARSGGPAPTPKQTVTMQDIADRVGVSKALVSMVFRRVTGPSAETRKRVLEVADELGYRPNRTAALMSLRRTHLVGVMADIRNSFHAEMVEYLVAAADEHGYEVVLGAVTPTHGEQKVVETLLDFRCEALILLGAELGTVVLDALAERVPVVVVGRRVGGKVDTVRTADGKGIGTVVDHVVELGHRRIVHLSGGEGTIAADRRSGYTRAMRRHGLDADVVDGDFTDSAGTDAAQALLARPQLPTAVIAANDRSAIGLISELRRVGLRIPEDVSVAGYDDSTLAQLAHLDLTSVNQQPREQAAKAVDAVIERLDQGRTVPAAIVLRPRLVVRRTTGPVSASVEGPRSGVS